MNVFICAADVDTVGASSPIGESWNSRIKQRTKLSECPKTFEQKLDNGISSDEENPYLNLRI